MDDLFELRFYVAKRNRFAAFRHQWATVHYPIYSDYHDVRGLFDVLRFEPDPVSGETAAGIGLLLRHEDRAAVDRSMNELIKSNRMNEVPGPSGRDIVDHWERTFLYPIARRPALDEAGTGARSGIYELRTWLTADDGLSALAEDAPAVLERIATRHAVEHLFASHPEHVEMPDGIATVIKHPTLDAAMSVSHTEVVDELRDLVSAAPKQVIGSRRLVLQALPNSPMR